MPKTEAITPNTIGIENIIITKPMTIAPGINIKAIDIIISKNSNKVDNK